MSDAADFVGSYGLDPTQYGIAPVAAPPSPTAPNAPPPLPQEPDAALVARAAVAEGDPNNPQEWQNIAIAIHNRMQASGQTAAQVLAEPGQFEAYGNGKIQGVDEKSPQFQRAMEAVQPVLSGEVTGPYDSFFNPKIVAQRGTKPPFDPSQGTMIGTQLFGVGGYKPQDDTAAFLAAHGVAGYADVAQPATPPPADTAGIKTLEGAPLSSPQAKTYIAGLNAKTYDPTATPGSAKLPLFASSDDTVVPTGAYYVDRSGTLHSPAYPAGQTSIDRAVAGAGQGVEDVVASVNQLTQGGLAVGDPMTAALTQTQGGPSPQQMAQASIQGERQVRNKFDWQYSNSSAAGIGRFVGQVAATAPIMAVTGGAGGAALDAAGAAVPALAPVADFVGGSTGGQFFGPRALSLATNGALQGAQAGALTSSTSDAPLANQMMQGAEVGALSGPAAGALGASARGLADAVSPGSVPAPIATLADKAVNQFGIPLRASQIAGTVDRNAAVTDSQLISRPGSGYAANNAAQGQAFTRAVSNTMGEDSPSITPEVMSAAKSRIGAVFNRVAANTTIQNADAVQAQIGGVIHDAQQVIPDSEMAPLLRQVENIGSVVTPGAAGAPATLSGKAYQALVAKGSPLDRLTSSSDPNVQFYAGQIKNALDDGLQASAAPEDLADLQAARLQYKNMKTIEPLIDKAGPMGQISPALLRGRVSQSFSNSAYTGAGDLGDLAQIGQTFMKEPPNSGTPARLKEMILGGAFGTGALADAGLAFTHPGLALKIGAAGAAAAGARYGSNVVSGALNNNQFYRSALLNQASTTAPSALQRFGISPVAAQIGGAVNDNAGTLGTLGYNQFQRQAQ